MSNTNEFEDAVEDARVALMKRIAQAAEESVKLNPSNQAGALKDLADAYARIIVPQSPR
ncbi:hypothetical protein [Streptomyces sp. NPDC051452]|uniref:hypothetical protein n=1 Tax=Streptomyces sp. NPDC051452 TaxID=3365654 RepID=UPI00379515D8